MMDAADACHVLEHLRTFVLPDWLYVWLAFLAKAAFSLAVRPADTIGAMDAAARQDAIACSVPLGGGLWSQDKQGL